MPEFCDGQDSNLRTEKNTKTSSHKSNTITKTQKLSQVCLEARHCLETGSPSLVVWSSRQQLAVTSLGEPECDSAVTQ